MEKFDYKKSFRELYAPDTTPGILSVPSMNFIMIDGKGNPNDAAGEYKKAVELLYALSYTIKMSKKSNAAPKDFFDYVVLPLEGLWWLEDSNSLNFQDKDNYHWTSMIRQPEFVTPEVLEQASWSVKKKKPDLDVSKARLEEFQEGLCVQLLHLGPYDTEPLSLEKMDRFLYEHHYLIDISHPDDAGRIRRHHEIYLSDPRRSKPDKLKTILRHPIKEIPKSSS